MFPNFKSLSDKERKRQKLLEKYNQEIANDEAKRQAYEDAIWADDQIKNTISLSSKLPSNSSSSTSKGLQSNPATSGGPSIGDIYASMADASSGGPSSGSTSSNSKNFFLNTSDLGTPPGSPQSSPNEFGKKTVEAMFLMMPELAKFEYNPFDKAGNKISSLYIGDGAKLFDVKTRQLVDESSYNVDWVLTAKVLDMITKDKKRGVFDVYETMSDMLDKVSKNGTEYQTPTRNLLDEFNAVEDIGSENDSMSDIDDTEDVQDDEMTQEDAKNYIEAIYNENPNLVLLKLSPIDIKTGKSKETFFIGKDGKIFNTGSGKPSPISPSRIDWISTLEYIMNKIRPEEFNRFKEKWESLKQMKNKRAIFDALKKNRDQSKMNETKAEQMSENRDRKLLKDVFDALKNNKDKTNETKAYYSIQDLFLYHPRKMMKLQQLGANHPLNEVGEILTSAIIEINNNHLRIMGNNGSARKREQTSLYKSVSWVKTLQYLIYRLNELGYDVSKPEEALKRNADASPYASPEDARKTTKQVRNENESVGVKPFPKSNDELVVTELVRKSPWLELPANYVYPIANNGKAMGNYYLGSSPDIDDSDNPTRGSLTFYSTKYPDTAVSKETSDAIYKKINWSKTLFALVDKLKQIRIRTTSRDLVAAINRLLKEYGFAKADGSEDQDYVKSEPHYQNQIKRKLFTRRDSGLIGVGLIGAGRTCLNLRDLEGTGVASDLKYKRIGSKFIRVKDLRENKLKIVYPNRTALGKIISISPELSALINELLFDKNINQQLYSKLNLGDKQLFHEILKITHLQHQFSNHLKDPLEELQAEFDKLRGQVALGNDNPELIRELKALAVDLYSQKLISEKDFKTIIMV